MKEKPILFSGEMVRAILSGAKSQTRRVIKPQPTANLDWVTEWGWTFFTSDKHISGRVRNPTMEPREIFLPCPYSLGQRLWVRETWAMFSFSHDFEYGWEGNGLVDVGIPKTKPAGRSLAVIYKADGYYAEEGESWRPSIHMPRWASRLTLEITSVKVERLQNISEVDAIAEGVWTAAPELMASEMKKNHIGAYRKLWDSINGKKIGCSWSENPSIWAITFRRID